jgi:hypothetical protein
MKRVLMFSALAATIACGTSSDGINRSGTGGSGSAESVPQSVDQTCRDWCANEAEGASCHQGPFESVEPCYESCLSTYQQERNRKCEEAWIAIKDCQVDLECSDLFGDCDSVEDQHAECTAEAMNREYCTELCPDMDPNDCDPVRCDANRYCEAACPNQDRGECIDERISQGQCSEPDTGTGEEPPGEPVGVFEATGHMIEQSCGAAVPAPDPLDIEFDLRREDGGRAYWRQSGGPIYAGIYDGDAYTFSQSQTWTVIEPDRFRGYAGCSVTQRDVFQFVLDQTMGSETVFDMNGSQLTEVVPLAGSDCTPAVAALGGPFLALPCRIEYVLTGSGVKE